MSGRLLPGLVAVLAPVLLLGALAAVLTAPEAAVERARPPAARALDDRIAAGADVVLLGNSKVGTDLDPDAIAALYPDEPRVVPMHVKGTGMPVWYTVLHDRVYGGGHSPRLVVVYGTLLMMAQAELPTAAQRAQLDAQRTAPNPVLDHKVFGEAFADPRLQVALRRRGAWRQALTDGIRDLAIGLFFAPPGEGSVLERGRADAVPALARVFDGDANQRAPVRRVVPVVEAAVADGNASVHLTDTLIPDLVELAYSHGAQVLFVRAPLPDERRGDDSVPVAFEDELYAWLRGAGVGYLDLRDADLSPSHYGGVHLSKVGRARFTPQLVAALRGVGVGSGHLTPASPPPRRVALQGTRTGTPPTLPTLTLKKRPPPCAWMASIGEHGALSDPSLDARGLGEVSPLRVLQDDHPLGAIGAVAGETCEGAAEVASTTARISPTDLTAADTATFRLGVDPAVPTRGASGAEAWWVYPGTDLTVTVPAGVVTGPRRLRVQGVPTLGGPGGAELRLGDAAAVPFHAVGATLEATVEAPATTEPWSFTVHVPADGPWLYLGRAVTGTEAEPVRLIGPADAPVTVDLLAGASFAGPPPALPPVAGTLRAGRGEGQWVYDVAAAGVPSQDEVFEASGTGCSALMLLENGVPVRDTLAADHKPAVKAAHAGGELRITVRDGHTPDAATLGLTLDATRRCNDALWLYPGDEVVLRADAEALAAFAAGADTLELGATAVRGEGVLHLRLEVPGAAPIESATPLSALPLAPIGLPGAVRGDSGPVTLTLRLESTSAYVLLTTVDLAEPPRPALGGPTP